MDDGSPLAGESTLLQVPCYSPPPLALEMGEESLEDGFDAVGDAGALLLGEELALGFGEGELLALALGLGKVEVLLGFGEAEALEELGEGDALGFGEAVEVLLLGVGLGVLDVEEGVEPVTTVLPSLGFPRLHPVDPPTPGPMKSKCHDSWGPKPPGRMAKGQIHP